MKKPINAFAVVLWLLAITVIVGDTAYLYVPRPGAAVPTDTFYVISVWVGIRNTILTASAISALGVIIELLDQVRWNALHGTKKSD